LTAVLSSAATDGCGGHNCRQRTGMAAFDAGFRPESGR